MWKLQNEKKTPHITSHFLNSDFLIFLSLFHLNLARIIIRNKCFRNEGCSCLFFLFPLPSNRSELVESGGLIKRERETEYVGVGGGEGGS